MDLSPVSTRSRIRQHHEGVRSWRGLHACRSAVTLTPQEQAYGLPTVSYVAQTELTTGLDRLPSEALERQTARAKFAPDVGQIQEFVVSVPVGTYDVLRAARSPNRVG